MPRVLGVDPGKARIGLALSDPEGLTAQPLEVVEVATNGDIAEIIAERVRSLDVAEIVVGIPVRLSGEHGPEAEAAEQLAARLEELCGVPVHRWDERLSTREAERVMRAAGTDARGQRGVVDKVAAAIILHAFLASRSQG